MRSFLCLLLAASLACGGGGGDSYDNGGPTNPSPNPSPPSGPAPSTASVEMSSSPDGYGGDAHGFVPNRSTISVGGTVTWSNPTGFMHNVTFSSSNAPAGISDFSSGSVQRTFTNAGTYSYSCTNHAGMTGSVVVQ